ncbi:MAG: hypothetical protein GWN01_09500, partial [Nitrosopumilaceae archaeon]|nr:hypothetical protein [Nitrosopumilaceae archaeon]NIU87517.1 hypothetical protein [Nitrosopumilaceae archaeon]NIX61742.1 hypothetical protein [Nitrosopumilaceae archaeon]
ITVESPPYYTGNFQGCIPVVEVLKYIGSRFFDNYAGFESKLLTGDSYVTKNNRHSGLYITHISNAREAIDNASYSKATIFNVTVRQILEYIAHTYDVLFKFENGIFKALEMHEIRDIDISND